MFITRLYDSFINTREMGLVLLNIIYMKTYSYVFAKKCKLISILF